MNRNDSNRTHVLQSQAFNFENHFHAFKPLSLTPTETPGIRKHSQALACEVHNVNDVYKRTRCILTVDFFLLNPMHSLTTLQGTFQRLAVFQEAPY